MARSGKLLEMARRRDPIALQKAGRELGLRWASNLARARTLEHQRNAGKKGGRASVASGHMFSIAKSDTKPELAVKAKLDSLGIRYEHPYNLNDKFFVDFYLPDSNTIIEVDGCYWHGCEECGYPSRKKRGDKGRNAYIQACGYHLEIVKEHELRDGLGA